MKSESLSQLARRIREHENASPRRAEIPLEIPGLEDVFAKRCLPAGSLVELVAASDGAGVWTLALLLGQRACRAGKTLVIADDRRRFYPPAACRLGVDLRRALILRPPRQEQMVTALVQSLQCAAVGSAIGWLERLGDSACRQLQLAAEAGGGVGVLLRPASALEQPSFAAVRLRVAPLVSTESGRRLRLEVLRRRGGSSGQTLLLEIDHETGDVRLPASVASAASVAASARASG